MEITTDALEWNSDDIAAWGKFLRSRSGQRLLPKLLESVPSLFDSGDTNKILIRSGEVRGWSESARTLLFLAREPITPTTEITPYPPLEDDRHWEGDKLTQP